MTSIALAVGVFIGFALRCMFNRPDQDLLDENKELTEECRELQMRLAAAEAEVERVAGERDRKNRNMWS